MEKSYSGGMMPELPEVEVLKRNLKKRLTGARIEDVSITKPHILKSVKPHFTALIGKSFKDFERRGKYIFFDMDGLFIVYHGGLSGILDLRDVPTRDTSFYLTTDRGFLIFRELSTKKTAGIHLTENPETLPFIRKLGIDALSVDFSPDYIKNRLRRRREWIFNILRDQGFVSGIGRAYASDILFEAKISPFKPGKRLTDGEIERLHYSTRIVLKRAIEAIERLYGDSLEIKEKRDFLTVYRKKDQPCPVCGDTIQWKSYRDYAIYYCPTCQGVE